MSGKDRGKNLDKDRKADRKTGRRVLSHDDHALWSDFTRKIAPLRKNAAPEVVDDIESGDAAAPPQRQRAKPTVVLPAISVAPPPLARLDRRARKRVASGRETIDGRLDLHGHTQNEAHAELLRFLDRTARRGARLVLVITGKSGVLRRQVPLWLALPELRARVIGFETAHAGHGGDGALYVRLRRSRGP